MNYIFFFFVAGNREHEQEEPHCTPQRSISQSVGQRRRGRGRGHERRRGHEGWHAPQGERKGPLWGQERP